MKKLFLLLLIILSIIPLFDLFHPGLPITHDGKDHVVRIANFYQNLREDNFIPRWGGHLNWGYGHPVLEFLYPLPSYVASLFHFIGFTFVDATKIVFAIGMVASGIAMYLWLATFLSVPAAFIGGLLYMFTPYRFVELYVRGDIGENFAFIFMPLTLLFIYRMYKEQKMRDTFLAAISFACLMISHNAIVLMYFPFIIFYCCYLIYISKHKKALLLNSCFFILLGFGLSAFFWIPALLEGKYTLRNIVTAGEYTHRFVSFPQLVYGSWNYGGTGQFSVQLGFMNWVILLISLSALFILWKQKKKITLLVSGLLMYTAVAIFIMLPQSAFIWEWVMLLQNFQFPWRFVAIPLFTTSVLGTIVISEVLKPRPNPLLKGEGTKKLIILFVVILILFFNKDYWHAKGYVYKPESFFTSIYDGTTDTGESSPIWSTRFMEKRFDRPLEVISGKAVVTQLERKTTKHSYTVNAREKVQLRENTVYFPGWEVEVNNVSVPIEYQDFNNRGVITFSVPRGKHIITVQYKETKLRKIADLISLLSVLVIVVMVTRNVIVQNIPKN